MVSLLNIHDSCRLFTIEKTDCNVAKYVCQKQCCGSGTVPHWFGSPGSGSLLGMLIRIRIQEQGNRPKFTNNHEFQPFKKVFVPTKYVGMVYKLLSTSSIFSWNIQFFVTINSVRTQIRMFLCLLDQAPDPFVWGTAPDPALDASVIKQK